MSEKLLQLIIEYQSHVVGRVRALREKFGVDDILGAVLRNEIPEIGSLDDRHETRFRFHGSGCHLESETTRNIRQVATHKAK